jgi:molybdate transport system regulatory protein
MRSKHTCWLDNGLAFGERPYRLLKAIEVSGSLNQAAMTTGMCYHSAWVVLGRFEKTVGLKLVKRRKGGGYGAGSRLTALGRKFVAHYEQFRTEATKAFEELFEKHFAR